MSKKRRKRLLRLAQVLNLYPVGRSTWYAGVKSGNFPKPVKIGCRCSAWDEGDINSLINEAVETHHETD